MRLIFIKKNVKLQKSIGPKIRFYGWKVIWIHF